MAQFRSTSRFQLCLLAISAFAVAGATIRATSPAAAIAGVQATQAAANTLTAQEQAAGWKLLFDGKTTQGWRNAHGDSFPSKGWVVKDDALTVLESGGGEAAHGGDIVTVDEYGDFEFMLDVKLTRAPTAASSTSSPRSSVRRDAGRPSDSSSSCWTMPSTRTRRWAVKATAPSDRSTT